MWNKSISLPLRKLDGSQDEEGFSNPAHEYLGGVPANFTDVTRNDEILAYQKGYTADQNVEIMACNYMGQPWMVDEETGDVYDIRRTYHRDKANVIVLTCERRGPKNRGGFSI